MNLKINVDWIDILNICRDTVGKEPLNKEPSDKFKYDLMLSEHSPIRELRVRWRNRELKSFVATHFSRHMWECYIGTNRDDRGGDKLANRDTLLCFNGSANAQNLIDTSRKRLCFASHIESVKEMSAIKMLIKDKSSVLYKYMVPQCVYRCGCSEPNRNCGLFNNLYKNATIEELTDINKRYEIYNNWFEVTNG